MSNNPPKLLARTVVAACPTGCLAGRKLFYIVTHLFKKGARKMKTEEIKFYLKNGNDYQGTPKTTHLELAKRLKRLGYKKYYGGVCEWDGMSTIVGIDDDNDVSLKQREKNGLIGAYESKL